MSRHTLIPASYLILEQDNKVLLSQRKNTKYKDGEYGLVAGHVEPQEDFVECLMREAKEEIGITIEQDDIECVHTMYRNTPQERVDIFFVVKKWKDSITNNEPDKCSDLKWFEYDKLPENIIDYIDQALKSYKNKEIYSKFLQN